MNQARIAALGVSLSVVISAACSSSSPGVANPADGGAGQSQLSATTNKFDVFDAIAPEKDVDGVGRGAVAALYRAAQQERMLLMPGTALAVRRMMAFYGVVTEGKQAVVGGRNDITSKPIPSTSLGGRRGNAAAIWCHRYGKPEDQRRLIPRGGHPRTRSAAPRTGSRRHGKLRRWRCSTSRRGSTRQGRCTVTWTSMPSARSRRSSPPYPRAWGPSPSRRCARTCSARRSSHWAWERPAIRSAKT